MEQEQSELDTGTDPEDLGPRGHEGLLICSWWPGFLITTLVDGLPCARHDAAHSTCRAPFILCKDLLRGGVSGVFTSQAQCALTGFCSPSRPGWEVKEAHHRHVILFFCQFSAPPRSVTCRLLV